MRSLSSELKQEQFCASKLFHASRVLRTSDEFPTNFKWISPQLVLVCLRIATKT